MKGLLAVFLGIVGAFLSATPVHAELPAAVLDRDYQNCMGNDKDPKRTAYCGCVRDGMRNWSENAYIEATMQVLASASGVKTQGPNGLDDLAKKCITQVLR